MFTQLKELLPRGIHRHNLSRIVTAAQVCEAFRHIQKTLFPDLSGMKPQQFRAGILTIVVGNPIVAQEISFKKIKLIKSLHDRLEQEGLVRDICVVLRYESISPKNLDFCL